MASITYDGVDLSGASYGLTLQEYDELMAPAADYTRIPTGGTGGRVGSSGYTGGTLKLPCVVQGSSTSDLQDKKDAIMRVLHAGNGSKKLILSEHSTRYWTALPVSEIPAPQAGALSTFFDLLFELEGPAKATTATTDSGIAIATDPDTFAISAPGGNEPPNVIWYIRNGTGADVTGTIGIDSTTFGEAINWLGTLENGFWLRIGSEDADGRFLYTLDKSTASGADPTVLTYSNAKTGVTQTGGDWPRLKVNTSNTISVSGLSTGTAQYSYRALYVGD